MNSLNYSYLDQQDFRRLYTLHEKPNSMQFFVKGIKCSNCIKKLESLPLQIPEVQDVRVEMADSTLSVTLNPQGSFAEFAQIVHKLGFEPIPLENSANSRRLLKKQDQAELIRLAVAGFCAGNIMTFSFATYFGLSGNLAVLFQWFSFVLYLPVLFYSALPFYKGFVNSIKQKNLSIDGPIALASVCGAVFSTFNLIRGQGSIYFDSLSGFLFLIMVSRYVQKRLQRSFLAPPEIMGLLNIHRVRRKVGPSFVWIPIAALQKDDVISVAANEVVPADGKLLSPTALFSLSFLSGESAPQVLQQNMNVLCGSQVLEKSAMILVTKTGSETAFGRILKEVYQNSLSKVRALNMADKVAQILVLTVFSVATIFAVFYWFTDPMQALERALALIILACPCALAFGTPLALAFSLRNANKKGIMVKNADTFEKCLRVQNIFLDKTGTVTRHRLQILKTEPAELPEEWVSIILALEAQSYHPVAFAIREQWQKSNHYIDLRQTGEIPGYGVHGEYKSDIYEVHSFNEAHVVGFFKNGRLLAKIYVQSKLHEESLQVVQKLKQHYRVHLLSGDQREAVNKIASSLGIDSQHTFANMNPEQKAEILSRTPHSLMIGDGVNDALAFKRASVGVAVSQSVELAFISADVYFLKEGLAPLLDLFQISQNAYSLIKRNLMISLAYNIVGGSLALLGYINPFVAAILMPISSGFILLSSWLGSRK